MRFKDFNISKKLLIGFGSMLILLLILGTVSFFGFSQYREIARDNVLMGRVQANLLMCRLMVKDFVKTNNPESVKTFNERMATTKELMDEADKSINDPERASKVDTMLVTLLDYEEDFGEVVNYFEQRDEVVQTNDALGLKMRENLTEIMKTAFRDKDPSGAYYAGRLQEHIILGRLYVYKYLDQNKLEDYDRSVKEFVDESDHLLLTLKQNLQNPTRRKLRDEVEEIKKEYLKNNEKIKDIIIARNDLIKNHLDVKGPQIADNAEWIKLDIKAQQDTLGPMVNTLIIIISLLSIVLAIFISRIIINSIKNPINEILSVANAMMKGDLKTKAKIDQKDEVGVLATSFTSVQTKIQNLVNDNIELIQSVKEGKLDKRANNAGYEGGYLELVDGVNELCDAFVGPINVTAEYVDRISKGDIPPKITDDYKGDFNEIKNNLNQAIDVMNGLLEEVNGLIISTKDGKLDARANASRFVGGWGELVQGVNDLNDAFVGPINVTAEYVDRISKGDIPPKIVDEYKGDFNEIKNNLNQAIDVMNGLLQEVNGQIGNIQEGKLDARANSSKFVGGWSDLVEGINALSDAFVGPLNVTAEYVDRISKGDIPPKIEDDYKGDFNEIKNNLNQAIDVMNGLLQEVNAQVNDIKEGKLDSRANASRFVGGWSELVQGINDLNDAFIAPLNVTAEYVDRIAKGDIPPKIEDEYKGDFNEIKNNLNQLIDNLNTFVAEMKEMSQQHDLGDIDIKIDEGHFTGAYHEMALGVNEMVFGHIEVKKKAMGVFGEFGNGNFDADIEKLPGKKIFINNTIDKVRNNLTNFDAEINMLIKATKNGQLEKRGDESKFTGGWADMIGGINELIQAFVDPLSEAGDILSVLATGDLTVRMKGVYKGDLEKLKKDINKLGDSLSNLINQVNDTVSTTASSAVEISSTAESLAAASQEQSAQADEVASAVEQMSRTVTENAMSANKTSEMAQDNSLVATEGGKVVQQTVQKMRDIAKVVENSAGNIGKLGESSKQIGEIISVIDDIADQTNLLALNAAIEAARAGEQGRGFAVVADEVRKLAERTTDATKQIADMIKGIQSETEQAVVAMNKGNEEVQSGIELADRAGQSLESILSSTQEVLDMINQIAAASEEQSATSEQISKNVVSISKVTADSTRRIEDVAHTSEDLAKLTEHLSELMGQFKVSSGSNHYEYDDEERDEELQHLPGNGQRHLPPVDID